MSVCGKLYNPNPPRQEAEAVIQSAMAGRGLDRLVDVDAPTMKQSVAWELALRAIHIREVRLTMTSRIFSCSSLQEPHVLCGECMVGGPACTQRWVIITAS